MRVYNIEVFDNSMLCIHHEAISEYDYDFDYLTPVQSKLELNFHDSSARFLRIVSDDQEVKLAGYIVSLDDGDLMTVGFKPFTSIFDINIMFDTNYQTSKDSQGHNTYALETVIKHYIEASFKESGDALQNLPLRNVTCLTQTNDWGMNLKSDTEGQHTCKINLYDVLINNSFTNYGIVVDAVPDPTEQVIDINIYAVTVPKIKLEIDAPGVTIKKFTVRDSSAKVNKLLVYNSNDYGWRPIIYYLYDDGTFGTTNKKRIFPVIPDVEAVDASLVDQGVEHAQKAKDAAQSKFGNIKFDNLIQIEVTETDTLIKPLTLKIGQIVEIVHNGLSYDSIVSAVKYENLITLTFGMLRVNATNKLRRLAK